MDIYYNSGKFGTYLPVVSKIRIGFIIIIAVLFVWEVTYDTLVAVVKALKIFLCFTNTTSGNKECLLCVCSISSGDSCLGIWYNNWISRVWKKVR
jgi:hypothetical protein